MTTDIQKNEREKWEKWAREGNALAKILIKSWWEEKEQQVRPKEDWFGLLIGIVGMIGVIVIFGVVILAIIKWAFSTVF